MPLAEYQTAVGPLNRYFHEAAEAVRLSKEGVIPVERDEDDEPTIHGKHRHDRDPQNPRTHGDPT